MTHVSRPACCCGIALMFSLNGCISNFGEQSESGVVTTTIFDDRLPLALEELWDTCQQDFLIYPDDTSIDLRGTCTSPPASVSSEAQALWLALTASGPLPIDIPDPLFDQRSDFADFPWPMQNCSVSADTEVHFRILGFETLEASWVRHDGGPALKVRLGNSPATWDYAPVWRSTIATAFCPSPINQGIVRSLLDSSGINDTYENITFDDMDVNLFIDFAVAKGKLTASLDVKAELTGMDLGIDFSKLPGAAEASFSSLDSFVTDELGDFLAEQLRDLPKTVVDQLSATIPDGDSVCSVKLEDGALQIESGHGTAFNPCVQIISSSVPPPVKLSFP